MFIPQYIDLGKSEKYILSVRIKSNGFMFSISEPEVGKHYFLQETSFLPHDDLLNNIQRIIFDLNFLTQEFKRTNVIIVSPEYDLIPASYYDSKEKITLYDFTHLNKSKHILEGLIEKQNIITLFNIEKPIFEFLSRNLWNPQFYHHSTLLANYIESKGKASWANSKMYLNFHDNLLDIFCFSGLRLMHSQTYENEPAANQLYYILKLWERCGFDQLNDYLYIIGNPELYVSLHVQEYIKNIERINVPSEIYLWSDDAQKAPLDLLTLSL